MYLGYMFLKERKLFDIVITNQLKDTIGCVLDYLRCPKHSETLGIISGILQCNVTECCGDYKCNLCSYYDSKYTSEQEIYLAQLEILSGVYKLLKKIEKTNMPEYDSRKYTMYIWLVEGGIRDYENIKNTDDDSERDGLVLFEQLKKIYLASVPEYQPDSISNESNLLDIEYVEGNLNVFLDILRYIIKNKQNMAKFKSLYLIGLLWEIEYWISEYVIKHEEYLGVM